MKKLSRKVTAALVLTAYTLLGLLIWALGANAAEVVTVPDRYRIAPPAVGEDRERPAAVNGSTYTAVTPIFDGDEGNVSYIRLANVNDFAVTITVSVVGSPTGRLYGAAAFTIPPKASKQYAYTQVLQAAGVTGYVGEDNIFSFYLRSSEYRTGYQHIIFNGNNGFFENMSVCTWDPDFDYTGLNRAVGNVHTTNEYMVEYPSIVMLHHYGATRGLYRADLYASETGEHKGGFSFYVEANETFVIPMSWYMETAGWTPGPSESHANIIFDRLDGLQFEAIAGQAIYNARLGAYINMSQFCGINH